MPSVSCSIITQTALIGRPQILAGAFSSASILSNQAPHTTASIIDRLPLSQLRTMERVCLLLGALFFCVLFPQGTCHTYKWNNRIGKPVSDIVKFNEGHGWLDLERCDDLPAKRNLMVTNLNVTGNIMCSTPKVRPVFVILALALGVLHTCMPLSFPNIEGTNRFFPPRTCCLAF